MSEVKREAMGPIEKLEAARKILAFLEKEVPGNEQREVLVLILGTMAIRQAGLV